MTLEQALRALGPLGGRVAPAPVAPGMVPARDVEAPADVPPHAAAAHGGYAVRAADVPGFLEPAAGEVDAGEAAPVAAGDPLPHGADAVVLADAMPLPAHVEVDHAVAPGDGVVPAGAVHRAGDVLAPAGTPLGGDDVARLARAGVTAVPVAAPPRVGIVGGVEAVAAVVRAAGGDPVSRSNLDQALDRDDAVLVAGRPPGESRWSGRDVALAECDGIPVVGVTGDPAAALPVLAGLLSGAAP